MNQACTHLYCCRGSSFPVFVSHSLEASTRTMLRKRKKFTCQQPPARLGFVACRDLALKMAANGPGVPSPLFPRKDR